jgi:long-chain acyl-CoA synthetase
MYYFYELNFPKENIAVITPHGQEITYGSLVGLCDDFSDKLDKAKKNLVLILCTNTYEALCGYLGCLRSNNVPLLLDANIDNQLLDMLVQKYNPDYIFAPRQMGNTVFTLGNYTLSKLEKKVSDIEINQDLGLLLSTSGSTGSPMLVRLSRENLQANADSICQYLNITQAERPVTVLPMQYTYGLSILNSHLNKGATILMTDTSIMQGQFWEFAKANGVTSLSGVPYTYQMYKRLRIFRMEIPTLRTMTQAGGKLPPELGKEFAEACNNYNINFFIMYGQTEATARMSYLPCDKLMEKYKSIGIPIPGGNFSIIDDNGNEITTPETSGELVYQGENVMMGYARCEADLAKGYELDGKLFTGDIATFDSDVYYYIVGRKKRFIKLFGNRINLDEIEQILKSKGFDCACTGVDDKLTVFVTQEDSKTAIKQMLTEITGINAVAFKVTYIEDIPKSEAGKTLYSKLVEVK